MKNTELGKEYALIGATLIDGNGGAPVRDTTVVVRNGVIEEAGAKRSITIKVGIQQVDLSGYYLMPGLIDVHFHFSGIKRGEYMSPDWYFESKLTQAMRTIIEARKVLDVGFTTVRSCGSRYDISLRQVIQEGEIIGPRVVASGLCICSLGDDDIRRDIYDVPYDLSNERDPANIHIAGGVAEMRKTVRMLCNQNVDLIKVKLTGSGSGPGDRLNDLTFSREEVEALIDEARMHNKRVAAHSECIERTRMAVELGVSTIEHGDCVEGMCLDDGICKTMIEKDIILVPTLSASFIGPWAVQEISEHIIASHKLAIKRGVKIALGSDAFADNFTPYGKYNIGEIKLLVDILGMTPLEAITSATKIGAEACGIGDKVGTIEKGKLADLLVVRGDLTSNIDILLDKENVKYIIKGGNLVIEH